jgi:DNA-binding MarR family transcriptional regulator
VPASLPHRQRGSLLGVCDPGRVAADLDLAGLDLILNGQEPLFEARSQASMNKALWFTTPADLLGSGLDYFGPVARRHRHRVTGFSKVDVAETTNVVWLDRDPPESLDWTSREVLLEWAERNINGLIELGLVPSVCVFSGRGHWCYWKLARHIVQADAESLMRRLYAQFRQGGGEWDIGRVARLPRSVNAKTGFTAYVMSVSGVVWEPNELAELLPDLEPDEAESVVLSEVSFDPSLQPGGKLPVIELPDGLKAYLDEKPPKKERKRLGIDGSAREQSIINRLVNAGFSDGQIALFFDHHQLPRHIAEKRRRHGNYSWLARSIAVSRARLSSGSSSSHTVSIGNGTYSSDEEQEPKKKRQLGWSGRRWWVLRDLPEGRRKLEVIAWVKETYGVERSQILRDLDWLEENSFIEQVQDESDRRVYRVFRTAEANELLAQRAKKGPPIRFLKGLPKPAARNSDSDAKTKIEGSVIEGESPPPKRASAVRPTRSEREEEEAAQRREIRRRQRSLINDVYRLHIPGSAWTYFQPITPIREWKKVLLHEQLPVAQDDIGFLYRSFISPKDETLGDPSAHDPIEERTLLSDGYPARIKYMGLVAEAMQVDDGFAVAVDEREGVQVPRIGLVVQAKNNFYDKLRSRHTGVGVFGVRKRGKGFETFYQVERYTDTITIPPHSFDLDAIIAELADPARAQQALASLPSGWHFNRYLGQQYSRE